MERLRAGYRLIAFLLLTVVMLTVFCFGLPFCLMSKKRRASWKHWIISHWASGIARLLGLRMNIVGTPPEAPFFLVCNHLSYVDILPFWKHLKTTFIAKSEIKGWPFFGQASQLLGIIFINRNKRNDLSRVNEVVRETMESQEGVILFPEGTTSKGEQVLPFNSSLFYYPAMQNIPVYYASISYHISGDTTREAWNDICWWGDMDFLSHFWGLLKIKSWTTTVHFGEETILSKNRKILARTLHQQVTESFTPTYEKK